jgi:hypothetical protein
MSDDYAGWKAAWSAYLTAVLTDNGINWPNEQVAQAERQKAALLRQKMTAQGITI